MRKLLLLDYDHTFYPPSMTTLRAVDDRINLYIEKQLGFAPQEADVIRRRLYDEYGSTLKGLELHHGVDRDHYCDFIHAIAEGDLPHPDPALRGWLRRLPHPFYLFTNARSDWAVRGIRAMGLEAILPHAAGARHAADGALPRLGGIFDIAFMDWLGKPHPEAYAKVEGLLRSEHGDDIVIYFADDREDNLLAARERDWRTIWITPPVESPDGNGAEREAGPAAGLFHKVVASLMDLDPDRLA